MQTTPFLYPPFYGRASEESIFDHSSPNYSSADNKIVTYEGETLTKNCPKPAPSGAQPPNGICDYGYGGYWSYRLGTYTFYNGHDGIDYGISYRPLLAAADVKQVVYAGWYNPQDHRSNLGIFVRLSHNNGYNTWYGHMSSISVQSCQLAGCAEIKRGDVIGVSGTTGNSSGAHLHFRVTNPQGRVIDPYGWAGPAGQDPWPYNQPESLWIQYPNNSASPANVYPSGASLAEPASPATGYLVDDLDPRFDQIPENCWTAFSTGSSGSQAGRLLAVIPITGSADTCKARWKFPTGVEAGRYAVYVRIPGIHATSEGAIYNIFHNEQSDRIVVNQAVFPNTSNATGWIFIGNYYFDASSLEYVQLGNITQDTSSDINGLELAADAVRFVPLNLGTATPSLTPTPSNTATITPTPTNSKTPTITITPSITRTPTPSKSPTITRTPTVSRTPTITKTPTLTKTITPSRTPTNTRTPSPTITIRPSSTRVPTITPQYATIRVYFARGNNVLNHRPPYEASGIRYVRTDISIYMAVLNEYFKGPGSTEYFNYGYRSLYDGFSGYQDFSVSNHTAYVTLIGTCRRQFEDYTIAQLIQSNLKQFEEIEAVKIFDAQGQTQNPDETGDSVPACLEIAPQASQTPGETTDIPTTATIQPVTTTPEPNTPTETPTIEAILPATITLTASPEPEKPTGTPTRWPTKTPRPTDTRWPTATTRP